MPVKLIIILPCYNEESILEMSFKQLKGLFDDLKNRKVISNNSKVCFVDDGSKDRTWQIIEDIQSQHSFVSGVKLARNYGHQFALLGGLSSFYNKFDIYITIDADLQDDINVIEEMIQEAEKGINIVYGVRDDRTSDSFFKRKTAEGFYKMMNALGVTTVYNHADYRLMDNKAVGELLSFRENNLFLRGIVPLIGLNYTTVSYKRKEREAGETKYPLRKMLNFAWEGVSSFSVRPMRLILVIGLITFIFSILISIWVLITYLQQKSVPGWASTIIPMLIVGGIQVISIGVIGEYIGKIYKEVKNRPRFSIEKTLL
jgi:glycosyltransferase involved in cell wall biosynthesis